MKLLLHICCAVCLAAPIKKLKDAGCDITGYFYNPNIHPFLEFRRRIKALKVLQGCEPFPVVYDEEYGLNEYLRKIEFDNDNRCYTCYELRLEACAEYAKTNGFDAFTTTLLFSKHQNHKKIKLLGNKIENKTGITFAYYDYRYLSDESNDIVKSRMIYKQSYCGCIFSEYERYKDTTRHLYKGNEIKPAIIGSNDGNSDIN